MIARSPPAARFGPTLCALGLALILSIGPSSAVDAQAVAGQPALSRDRELVIGTKEAPPFAMKASDGTWSGISIDLWRHMAAQLGVRFRFVEAANIDDLLTETANQTFDAAIAAITVTAARQRLVDFTQPFYATGLGIAVSTGGGSMWEAVWRAFFSFGFLQAVMVLILAAFCVGALLWALEHRHNENFAGFKKGLGSGVWWSATTMTKAGAAETAPTTLLGRTLAIAWMIASVIAIAIFTAAITSTLTKRELLGAVQGLDDLRDVRVGAVANSAGAAYLDRARITHRTFSAAEDGLKAVQENRIDAFVHDRPLLTWLVLRDHPNRLRMVDTSFDDQNYTVALPKGSPLRSDLDLALLDQIESEWWQQTLFQYIGKK